MHNKIYHLAYNYQCCIRKLYRLLYKGNSKRVSVLDTMYVKADLSKDTKL